MRAACADDAQPEASAAEGCSALVDASGWMPAAAGGRVSAIDVAAAADPMGLERPDPDADPEDIEPFVAAPREAGMELCGQWRAATAEQLRAE